jgi:hypothetical protein
MNGWVARIMPGMKPASTSRVSIPSPAGHAGITSNPCIATEEQICHITDKFAGNTYWPTLRFLVTSIEEQIQ